VGDREGKRHHMAFERGETTKKLEVIGKAKGTGTTFGSSRHERSHRDGASTTPRSPTRLRELAFLNKALTIHAQGRSKGPAEGGDFFYKAASPSS